MILSILLQHSYLGDQKGIRLVGKLMPPVLQKLSSGTHTHTHLTALCLGLPGWAGTRKGKPIWIFLEQETVSGSGISWTICKSAPCSRQITMPAPTTQFFYRPDALPATQPTVSKHWRLIFCNTWRKIGENRLIHLETAFFNSPLLGMPWVSQ